MKKLNLTLIICIISGSVFFQACQIDTSSSDYIPLILEGQDYVDNHETPPFFYQYEEKNMDTESTRGWLIDKYGYLRSYENVSVQLFKDNNLASMNAFLEQTKIVSKIDIDALVTNYKKNLNISRIDPMSHEMEAKVPVISTYNGYTLSYPDSDGSNCSSRRRPGYYNRFVLESKGDKMIIHEHTAARAVLAYLKNIAKDESI